MTALLAVDDLCTPDVPVPATEKSVRTSVVAGAVSADADPSDLSVDELAERIVGLAGRLAATTCRWLLLVAHFDAREGYARIGIGSTARWLSHCCGLSHRTAVEHVRVARALAAYPQLADAMSSGRLSFSHVRAISRLVGDRQRAADTSATSGAQPEPTASAPDESAPVDPVLAADPVLAGEQDAAQRAVADLIDVAEAGTVSQLETVVRGLRTVERADGPDSEDREYVRQSWTTTSQWGITARVDAERGGVVQNALERVARAEGLTRVDAFVRMAELALVMLNDAERTPRELRGDERAAIVVHLDVATAIAASAEAEPPSAGNDASPRPGGDSGSAERLPGIAHIEDGPGLAPSVVRRLMCDGRIRTALHDQSGVCNLGRSHRTVSRRQYRALLLRDGGCRHPGCGSRQGLEAHHVQHWIDGGRTDMVNLLLLCRLHHHRHHEGAFAIEPGQHPGASFTFRRADGRELACHVDPSTCTDAADRAGGPDEDACDVDAADPGRTRSGAALAARRWIGGGQRLDRPWAVSVLAQRRSLPSRRLGDRQPPAST